MVFYLNLMIFLLFGGNYAVFHSDGIHLNYLVAYKVAGLTCIAFIVKILNLYVILLYMLIELLHHGAGAVRQLISWLMPVKYDTEKLFIHASPVIWGSGSWDKVF